MAKVKKQVPKDYGDYSQDEKARIRGIMYQAHARGMSWEEAAAFAQGSDVKVAAPRAFAPKEEEVAHSIKTAPVTPTPQVQVNVDDLTKIKGISSGVSRRLGDLGVTRYGQIAGWSDRQVAFFDKQLNLRGRIERDSWVEQANILLGKD